MKNFYLVIVYQKTLNGAKTKHTYFDDEKSANQYIKKAKKWKSYDGYKLLFYNYKTEPASIERISMEI